MSAKTAFTSGQLVKLIQLLEQFGVTPHDIQLGFHDGIIADLAEFLGTSNPEGIWDRQIDRNELRRVYNLNPRHFNFAVDYTMTLKEMLQAQTFDFVHGKITFEQFPHDRPGLGLQNVRAELIKIDMDNFRSEGKLVASPRIIAENYRAGLWRKGYRFANVMETVAFNANYLKLPRPVKLVTLNETAMVPFRGEDSYVCLKQSRNSVRGNLRSELAFVGQDEVMNSDFLHGLVIPTKN